MARAIPVSFAEAERLIAEARQREAGDPASMAEIVAASKANTRAKHKRDQRQANEHTRTLIAQCMALGCPEPSLEWDFRADRRWRFDLAWDRWGIAAELEGGIHTQGRHTRAAGFIADAEKYNSAICMGWQVIRIPTPMITNGHGAVYIAQALAISGCPGIARQRLPWESGE
jgi:hypothetical protein